ncbi:MAG: ABC transporter permease subunit, partial [Actinobacteria bacterium]|nr:ABC transporter permease subunit [Actinomycetota bacterium]
MNLIAKVMRDRWKGLATYSFGIFVYGALMTAIYPALSGIEGLTKYTKAMPDVVMKLFGSTGEINFMNFNNYVGLEFLSLMVIVIAAPFVIGFADQMVCGELYEGTLELLMSQPIRRWEMLSS